MFFFLLDLFIVASQLHNLHFWATVLFEEEEGQWLTYVAWLVQLLVSEAHLFLLHGAFFTLVHVSILLATVGIVLTQLFTVKIEQVGRILVQPRKLFARLNLFCYSRFLRENAAFLVSALQGNRMFSDLFLAFVLVNVPANCVLMVLLLTRKGLNLPVQFFMVAFILMQWTCNFAMHLQAVRINRQFHAPSKRVLRLMATDCLLGVAGTVAGTVVGGAGGSRLRLKLKLNHYIAAFHVPSTKRYGLMYGKISLISLMSFAEVHV